MSRTRLLLLGLAALALAACQDTLAPTVSEEQPTLQLSMQQAPERVVPGRIIARLADGADAATVAASHGVAFERTVARGRLAIFRGAAGNERALAARMSEDLDVVYAEPDYLRQPIAIDPSMWSLRNDGGLSIDYTRGRRSGDPVTNYLSTADADIFGGIGTPPSLTGGQVKIASIDTGVEFGHPEFGSGATIRSGYDYVSDDADASDENDHGTHTTGTMVGNSVGVAGAVGLAGNVEVVVFRVCGPVGCPTSAIVAAIDSAAAEGVVAMNLSLGGSSISQAERDAIAAATAAGSLVIAAAGNGGTTTVSCPACDPNAISVSATNWQDELTYYSDSGEGLDISAPGGEMYSNTTEEAGIYSAVRGGYAYFQGTSMATPHVTGAAAVIASVKNLTTADAARSTTLRALLLCNAHDVGGDGYDTTYGFGRLDLQASLAASPSTNCETAGGGGGDGGGGSGGGGGGGSFTVDYDIGKSRGANAIRVNSITGTPGQLLMENLTIGGTPVNLNSFSTSTIYSTDEKGGYTYRITICNTESQCLVENRTY